MSLTLNSPVLAASVRPWRAAAARLLARRPLRSSAEQPSAPPTHAHGDLAGAYLAAHRGVVR